MTQSIGGGGRGGAFADTDDDNVAELQEDHADFQGGDARNLGHADSQSSTTDDLLGKYPSKIRLIRDEEVVTTVDPATTKDPVQATLDQSERGDTLIFPSYASITESGPIYPRSDQTWHPNGVEITITGDSDGLVIDGNAYGQGYSFLFGWNVQGNLTIAGQGDNSGQGGYAFHRIDGMADCSFHGRFQLRDWDGTAWKDDSGSSSFQNTFSYIKLANVDGGDDNGLMWADGGGAPETVAYLAGYPTATGSAANSTVINGSNGPGWNLGIANIGGSAGTVFEQNVGSIHGTRIGHINYEPNNQQSAASNVVFSNGASPVAVQSVSLLIGATDYVFDSYGTDNVHWGTVRVQNGTINTNHVNVRNAIDTDATAYYAGPSAEVDNGNGGRGMACLSDLTLKT